MNEKTYTPRHKLDSLNNKMLLDVSLDLLDKAKIFPFGYFRKVRWLVEDVTRKNREVTDKERLAMMGFIRGTLKESELVLKVTTNNFRIISKRIHDLQDYADFLNHKGVYAK